MLSPPSMYSNKVWTGTRVPVKQGVPPRRLGSLVMSGCGTELICVAILNVDHSAARLATHRPAPALHLLTSSPAALLPQPSSATT